MVICVLIGALVSTEPDPEPAADGCTCPRSFSAAQFRAAFLAAAASRGGRPSRALIRYGEPARDGLEIEDLADKIAQRDDQIRRVRRPPGGELRGCRRRQTNLLFGAQQDDVGQGCFDGIANAPRAIGTRPRARA